jgi:head-tail adaptor
MIKVNIAKAQDIANDMRRAARSAEFAPLDIKATIPSEAAAAEEARAAIRIKYEDMQAAIAAASDVASLKTIVEGL